MPHSHSASHQQLYGKGFAIGIGLNVAYVIVEVAYGLIIDSSALLADAGVAFGVDISRLLIIVTGAMWLDPVTSFLLLVVIVYGTGGLFIDSINLFAGCRSQRY